MCFPFLTVETCWCQRRWFAPPLFQQTFLGFFGFWGVGGGGGIRAAASENPRSPPHSSSGLSLAHFLTISVSVSVFFSGHSPSFFPRPFLAGEAPQTQSSQQCSVLRLPICSFFRLPSEGNFISDIESALRTHFPHGVRGGFPTPRPLVQTAPPLPRSFTGKALFSSLLHNLLFSPYPQSVNFGRYIPISYLFDQLRPYAFFFRHAGYLRQCHSHDRAFP